MSSKVAKLSIICPAFNEEEILPRFHRELLRVVDDALAEYEVEILYVDDGSRDGTLLLLRRWAAADTRVRYLSFSRNFGHQAALTAGMEHARGDVLITLDSDLQHPPALIPALLRKWRDGYEIVVTVRADDPTLTRFKRFSSHAFYVFMKFFSEMELRAAAADYRLLSRRAAEALGRMGDCHRFLRGMVQWLGFPTAEVFFEPERRSAGVSKFNLRRMAGFALDGIVSFSRGPVRAPLYLGLFVLLGTAVCGLAAGARVLVGTAAWDWASLMLLELHALAGLLLCSVGLVGEYVSRTFDQVRRRPLYLLKETAEELAAGTVRLAPAVPHVAPGPRQDVAA